MKPTASVAMAAMLSASACAWPTRDPMETGRLAAQYPAWSLDGRSIVFLRPGANGEVWIVSGNMDTPRRLLATAGRVAPMMRWSPDGRSVLLEIEPRPGAQPEVGIVRVSDGGLRTLVIPGFAPRWSPDGTAVAFLRRDSATGRTELWEAGPTSGSATRIAAPVADHDFLWTPDGNALIYAARSELHLVSRRDLGTRTLTRFDAPMGLGRMANIDVSRDGRLAFVRGGRLRTLDLATGALVEVAEVRRPRGIAFSPDGKTIALFERFPDGIIVTVPSTGGHTRAVGRVTCLVCRIRFDWAPDSRRIATVNTTVDQHDLYVVAATGGESRLAARDVSWSQSLRSFSPSARHVVYATGALGPANDLFVFDLETGQSRRLTGDSLTSKMYPQWSPNGRWIAYFAGRAPDPQSSLELWVVSADGGEPRVLTQGMGAISGDGFDWAAESDALLFVSGHDNELWTVSVPDGELHKLSSTGAWDDPWKGLPSWRPAGAPRAVAYVGAAPLRVRALSLDGGKRWDVSALVNYGYSWAPDGDSIAFANRLGISVVSFSGDDPRQLTVDGGDSPVWAPRGSRVAYLGRDGEIWSVSTGGDRPDRLTSGAAAAGLTFSPDSRWIAYHRRLSDPHLRISVIQVPE
jgi:Tol biopolymer transport system component